jgi:hypothetical protein
MRAGITPSHRFGVTIGKGDIDMPQKRSQLVMVWWVHVYSPVVASSEVGISHCGETARQVPIIAQDI